MPNMPKLKHKFADVEYLEELQRISLEILNTLHVGLAQIATTPLLPGSALEMKSIAEQSLIQANLIGRQLGGKSDA